MTRVVFAKRGSQPCDGCGVACHRRTLFDGGYLCTHCSTTPRFWAMVDRRGTDECWPWLGATTRGYGTLYVAGRTVRATRIMWRLTHGSIADDLHALHKCDNPLCVNPEHLFVGTDLDNHRDACRKGRNAHGERNGHAKITADQVRAIRCAFSEQGVKQSVLARQYGLSPATVHGIVHGDRWRSVQ